MHCRQNSKHSFPIVNESEIISDTERFLVQGIKSKEHSVKRLALCLLLDKCRPEFPTKSVRDIFSCFLNTNNKMNNKWYSEEKIYSGVILCLPNLEPFKKFNREIKKFCDVNDLDEYYSNVICRNIIVDKLLPPLEMFTYFRTRTSGKFIPRIFADRKGSCFDPFGIKLSDYSYDIKQHILTELSSGFKFIVPNYECNFDVESYLDKNCSVSFLYGRLAEKITMPNEYIKAFRDMFQLEECYLKGIDYHNSLIYNPKTNPVTISYERNKFLYGINNLKIEFRQ